MVGAASRSRFYLLNPEYDPEERAEETKQEGIVTGMVMAFPGDTGGRVGLMKARRRST